MEFSVEGALVCGGAPAARVRRETEVFLEEKAHEKRRTHPLFYAFCCGAGALLAVFGLFAGMLLPYSAAAMAVAGRDTMMGSSLFGMTAELLRGSLPQADSAYSLLLEMFLAAAALSAAFALGCSVLAFAAGRAQQAQVLGPGQLRGLGLAGRAVPHHQVMPPAPAQIPVDRRNARIDAARAVALLLQMLLPGGQGIAPGRALYLQVVV